MSMLLFVFCLVVGVGMFVESILVEGKAPPVAVGDASLPPTTNERHWAALRVGGVCLTTIGLCGSLIVFGTTMTLGAF